MSKRRIAVTVGLLAALLGTGCPMRRPGGDYVPDYQLELPAASKAAVEPGSVSIFFCLDTSGSMSDVLEGRRKIDISKDAMRQSLRQIDAYLKNDPTRSVRVGLCSFEREVQVLQPLAPFDLRSLAAKVDDLQPAGGTAIGLALAVAAQQSVAGGAETQAILVMTDGANNNGPAPQFVLQAIKQNRNNQGVTTADIDVSLLAFDIDAAVFAPVREAGAKVVESRDQKSLETLLNNLVEEVLLEAE